MLEPKKIQSRIICIPIEGGEIRINKNKVIQVVWDICAGNICNANICYGYICANLHPYNESNSDNIVIVIMEWKYLPLYQEPLNDQKPFCIQNKQEGIFTQLI